MKKIIFSLVLLILCYVSAYSQQTVHYNLAQLLKQNINIIQVYAPTADKPDEEMGEFYRSITELLRALPKQEILITMGDFNSKLGGGYRSEYIGPHGLGERNHRGDIMEVFVEENEFVVINTQFKMPPRKFYTWKSPLSGPNRPFRNQIDYILIK